MGERRITLGDDGRPVEDLDNFTAQDAVNVYRAWLDVAAAETKAEARNAVRLIKEAASRGERFCNYEPKNQARCSDIIRELQGRGFEAEWFSADRDGSGVIRIDW